MNNKVQEGDVLTLAVPVGTVSCDPVLVGGIVGVAEIDRDTDGEATVATEGVFDLSVKAITDAGNEAIGIGDPLYINLADTPKISKKASGHFFGYALETVSSGSTATINVKLGEAGGLGQANVPPLTPADQALLIRNETGGNLVAGDLVYVSSWSETHGRFLVTKADADAAGRMAKYVMTGTLATATNGEAFRTYRLTAQNTNGAAVGDPVYLDTTAGGYTLVAPTGADDIVQIVGRVAVVDAAIGEIEFDLVSNNTVLIGTNELQALSVTAAKLAADAVETAKIKDDAVTKAKLAGGFMKSAVIAGGAAGNHTVTGIATADEIVLVARLDVNAGNVVDISSITSEFTISAADTINNAAGTDTTGDKLLILYLDLT